jgi:hypothetical protein
MAVNNIDWDFILGQIANKKLTPIISNQLVSSTLFGNEGIIRAWANSINYPLVEDQDNLTRAAQFLSVTTKNSIQAKSNYLRFLNRRLIEFAKAQPGADGSYLTQVERDARTLTFSQLATERLSYPNFRTETDHPLAVLASLDIPIFLTTSHHHFIEAALRAMGKAPRTEVYCWREGLAENIPPDYCSNFDFEPAIKTPLVYHLHGIDDYPDSLVLTEDDHLEFLVNVTQDIRKADQIPSSVRNTLSNSMMLLLGYELHDWDLRVLVQGLIRGKSHRFRSFAIQLEPSETQGINDPKRFSTYLQEYFDKVEFDIYWGHPQEFTAELWEKWESF